MCRYITDYPEADVDDALEEGLPDHMLQLVRKGLARATHTQLPMDQQLEATALSRAAALR